MVRILRVPRAELTKAVTLPAVWAGAAVTVLGSLLFAVLSARPGSDSPFEVGFAALPVTGTIGSIVIGIVIIGSEYTADRAESGGGRQITTTLTLAPHRLELLVAKVATVLVCITVTALVAIPGPVLLASVLMDDTAVETVDAGDMVLRGLGAALYWACMGLIGFAVTVLTRSGVLPMVLLVANSGLVSVTYLLTGVTGLADWLPDMAGRTLFGVETDGGLSPGPGAVVMVVWTVALLVVAAVAFRRRDA